MKKLLNLAVNEKDVENAYRAELLKTLKDSEISSPFGVDGLLTSKKNGLKTLLEFKHERNLKDKLAQSSVLIQCLYYIKKFEDSGLVPPNTIFVGDKNECFVLHTNSIVKYLSSPIDWKIAPSDAAKKNFELVQEMANDEQINPFIFEIDESFNIESVIEKTKEFASGTVRKVRITEHNISTIFNYFLKNILNNKNKLNTNEEANLFIQIIINPNENYIHPKKKNTLITKSFGDVNVNTNTFNSFFKYFEGDLYSPKEKENLTALVDRLIEDTTRRSKGEFFTPTPFVDLAHKYISEAFGEDWKERYIVWDCAWGTGNLTRDYQFKELYCSTLEQSDIDTANQMGYNPEATKFQFDFLNDEDSKLPAKLQEAINRGKEILFFINPPYATATNMTRVGDNKGSGVTQNKINNLMLSDTCGKSSTQLYAQFLYKICQYQKQNKNIKLCIFCKPLYFTGSAFENFRKIFFNLFKYKNGFMFNASHFDDVSKNWGVDFSIFNNESGLNDSIFEKDIVDINNNFEINIINKKCLYNLDNDKSARDWAKYKSKKIKNVDCVPLAYATINRTKPGTKVAKERYVGTMLCMSNNVYLNNQGVAILTSGFSNATSPTMSIVLDNFYECVSYFVSRKAIIPDWINDKDEYLAPNESHPDYQQFTYDSIVYSLFNGSSQQSSLRQVEYKDKLWDIKNEFFWMSKDQMLQLANDNNYDELYKDAKNGQDRYVYTKLFGQERIYDKLSLDAKAVLDMATDMAIKSIGIRKLMAEERPEYHLNSWDAGYAQLKLVYKEYMADELKAFRDLYKRLEDRMRPLVYELGFLRK